jgi:hypothetical protein
MDLKQHRANAVYLLNYIEGIKEDPNLIPPDGTLETTIEIAVAKELNRMYDVGFDNCILKIHKAIKKIKP